MLIFAPAFDQMPTEALRSTRFGKMAEWSIAAVLKTVDLQGFGGSNPSLSAIHRGGLGNPSPP